MSHSQNPVTETVCLKGLNTGCCKLNVTRDANGKVVKASVANDATKDAELCDCIHTGQCDQGSPGCRLDITRHLEPRVSHGRGPDCYNCNCTTRCQRYA
jgi:hypothetical protein